MSGGPARPELAQPPARRRQRDVSAAQTPGPTALPAQAVLHTQGVHNPFFNIQQRQQVRCSRLRGHERVRGRRKAVQACHCVLRAHSADSRGDRAGCRRASRALPARGRRRARMRPCSRSCPPGWARGPGAQRQGLDRGAKGACHTRRLPFTFVKRATSHQCLAVINQRSQSS